MTGKLRPAKARTTKKSQPQPRQPTRGQSVGVTAIDANRLIESLRRGLPYTAITKFEEASGLSLDSIAGVVQLPLRTLARRRKAGRFEPLESERLLRLGLIFEQACSLFDGDRTEARRWLTSPAKALGGETPLMRTQTEIGGREVEDLIGRLEHGVFS